MNRRDFERKYPDEYIVDTICRFAERVNKFPCTQDSRMYWGLMDKAQQKKILIKWYDMAKAKGLAK